MKSRNSRAPIWGLFFILLLITGCATYAIHTSGAQNAFSAGNFDLAAEQLDLKSKEEGIDQLLYLFDRGMALQLAGRYKESCYDWLKADKMSEVKDYTSISTEALTLVTSENIKDYKGEDFEKVIINAMLAINYVMDKKYDDALVEARRVNQKLYKYKYEAKRDYEQNPFARYLAALVWEATGKYDDAYIDYKETAKLVPDYPYLKNDLFRLAKRLNRTEDLKDFRTQYGNEPALPSIKDQKRMAEVILIYQQGYSAMKRPRPENYRFPHFVHRPTTTQVAQVQVDGKTENSQRIYSVSEVAIKTLDDAYAGMVAKKMAGVATKAVVADQIRQKNNLLGQLAWIGMNLADQADVRYWVTLPETLQFARLYVEPGEKSIKVVGLDSSMNPSGEEKLFTIKARPGEKVFLNWRSLR